MKSAAVRRKKLKQTKQDLAVIACQIRGQAQLDRMLMRYPDNRRKVIFKAIRPFLRFGAVYPTEENTAEITTESFAKLQETYGRTDEQAS